MDIDQRALDLARHLLDIETKSKIRKNKRSPSDIDKFIKSTQWLSKRILSNYAASSNAQTRLARDKNRYKANSHNIDGLGYDILIKGVVFWLEVEGFIYTDKNAIYRKEEAKEQEKAIAQLVSYCTWGAATFLSLVGFYCLYEFTNFLQDLK